MNNLYDFTFADTGKSVKIRKVSPMLAADVETNIPKPKPPVNEVDYGAGKEKEENYSDPAYQRALLDRIGQVNHAVTKATILRGVIIEGDEWKAEVEEYKKFILDVTGQPLEETNDLYIYIMRICCGTQEDFNDLLAAITTRSQPTEAAVQAAKDRFQSPV